MGVCEGHVSLRCLRCCCLLCLFVSMFLEGMCVGLLGLMAKKALFSCINLHIYILTLSLLLACVILQFMFLLSFFSLL